MPAGDGGLASATAFARRYGGLLGAWEDGVLPAGVSPFFDPKGFWDVCLPALACMCLLATAFKAAERRLLPPVEADDDATTANKGGRRVLHIFCVGIVSRLLLLALPWLPYPHLRTRWDWWCTAPTIFETLAHLWHWRDTSASLKWSLLGHHTAVLLVVWPLARLVEVTPYPVSALTMVLFFEVGSAWSYLSYLVKSRGAHALHAAGLDEWEPYAIPGLIWLCYGGQRLMRALALWEGFLFLGERPEYAKARVLQAVMAALECHGAWRCLKHLPGLGSAYRKRPDGGRKATGQSTSGKGKAGARVMPLGARGAPRRAAPAAGGSPGSSPGSSPGRGAAAAALLGAGGQQT